VVVVVEVVGHRLVVVVDHMEHRLFISFVIRKMDFKNIWGKNDKVLK